MSVRAQAAPMSRAAIRRRGAWEDAWHDVCVAIGLTTVMVTLAVLIAVPLAVLNAPVLLPPTPVTITATTAEQFGGSYAIGKLPTGEDVLVDEVAVAGQTMPLWVKKEWVTSHSRILSPVYWGTPPPNFPYVFDTLWKTVVTSALTAIAIAFTLLTFRYGPSWREFFPRYDDDAEPSA